MNKSLVEIQAGYDKSEDDLTWFARNVHEWLEDAIYAVKSSNSSSYFPIWYYEDDPSPDKPMYSRQQWLNRRAELQNKPSWEDAPEWANYLAQDADGEWTWFEYPCVRDESEWNEHADFNGRAEPAGGGEVLGDWRNTLEKRPTNRELNSPTSSMTKAQQIQAAIDTGICGDGKPCGGPYYCYKCPNDPQQTALDSQFRTENGFRDEKPGYENQSEQHLDMVNHPEHYQSESGIECIEAIRAQMTCDQFAAYCQGNIIKYLWRWREKGGVESLKKAKWYLYRMIAEVEDE